MADEEQQSGQECQEVRDFFISFNKADRAWATWIAWVLEETGYTVWFQDWDFRGNFVLEMDRAHTLSRRTIAVLSPDYLASRFTKPEWAARFEQDSTSEHDLLIPVRVREAEPQGLLRMIVYVRPCWLRRGHRKAAASRPGPRRSPQARGASPRPERDRPRCRAHPAAIPQRASCGGQLVAADPDWRRHRSGHCRRAPDVVAEPALRDQG
jgi:hypothetical protein